VQERFMETISEIPFDLDVKTLMERVHVEAGSDDAGEFLALVEKARSVANPKAVYAECFIDDKGMDDTVTIGGTIFRSRTLRRNLDKPERVFAYVATCGRELDALPLPAGDMLMEFWRDAIKTALLWAAMQHLSSHLNRRYRLDKTAAMSPGSGDVDTWPIEQQAELFALLGGKGEVRKQSGVELTDSFLMIPNKSVSGIQFPTETDFRSCQVCHRADCPSRGAPFDQALWEMMQHP
jgi:hypothetical protein